MKSTAENSEQYLNQNIGKTVGFKVPDTYFDTVEEAVFSKLAAEEWSTKTGFNTPENYFDTIEDQVFTKLEAKETPSKVISLRTQVARFASFAAAASVLVLIGFQFFYNATLNTVEQLGVDEVESWMNTHINQIENDELMNAFEAIDFEDTELLTNTLTNEAIESYLYTIEAPTLLNEIQ